jgi:signal peptide peptidase SppA
MNNFLGIINSAWAIEPSKLIEIQALYSARMRGEQVDLAAVEKKLGRPLANEARSYSIQDGVAVLPLDGVLGKKMNLMTQISGGTSTQLAAQSLTDALNDPAVHSVVLSIDSPGGTVDGTQILANAVYAARQVKPVVALANGCMCSAAYWIGSAAQSVFIADSTTLVGSIGVVASHTDVSGSQLAQGVKTTEISAGKYKRIASNYEPLTPVGRQSIQDQVDYTYSLFVDAVAKNRGVNSSVVLRDMADGRVFMGKQSIDAGLTDGIVSLDSLVAMLNKDRTKWVPMAVAQAQPPTRIEMDQATKAYMAVHPGMDYVAAFKQATQGA